MRGPFLVFTAPILLLLLLLLLPSFLIEGNVRRTDQYLQQVNVTKEKELTVFLAVTSAPWYWHLRDAARETWLLPCRASPVCDYRFFVDRLLQSVDAVLDDARRAGTLGRNRTAQTNISIVLAEEQVRHGDLAFRANWCPYVVSRHPEGINYGSVFKKHWVYGGGGVKYYNLRGMYKVDWKICFARWAKLHYPVLPWYHVYVEDDFFVCTENLLFQTTLLRNLPPDRRARPFRTGFPMWDGFDDSSTFMSREIVQVFAEHYPTDGFNCSVLADDGNPSAKFQLSWGNSWRDGNCAWREELRTKFNVTVIAPFLSKNILPCVPTPPRLPWNNKTAAPTHVPTAKPSPAPSRNHSTLLLPCPKDAMILHHNLAGDMVSGDPLVAHACEYMLLIDKVKDPTQMWKLWNSTTHSRYHDFTPVLLNDGASGWNILLASLQAKEKACPPLPPDGPGPGASHNSSSSSAGGAPAPAHGNGTAVGREGGGHDGPANAWEAQANDCVQWRRRRARRNRRLSEQVYGGSLAPRRDGGGGNEDGIDGDGDGDVDDPGIAAYYPDILDQDGASAA